MTRCKGLVTFSVVINSSALTEIAAATCKASKAFNPYFAANSSAKLTMVSKSLAQIVQLAKKVS